MNYSIEEIEGIGKAYATKLITLNIKTTKDLLSLCCDKKGRKTISDQLDISEKLLLKWVNLADLMRIDGIGKQYSELLEAAGVDTVKELRNRKPENLLETMVQTNDLKNLCNANPGLAMIEEWVEQAKKINPLISH